MSTVRCLIMEARTEPIIDNTEEKANYIEKYKEKFKIEIKIMYKIDLNSIKNILIRCTSYLKWIKCQVSRKE